MTESIRVLDISGANPPPEWYVNVQKPPWNVRGLIISAWDNGPADDYHKKVILAHSAFLPVATYCWPPAGAVQAIAYMRSEPAPEPAFFVLDVELADGFTPEFCALRRDHIDVVRQAGLAPWVYSSEYEWSLVMGKMDTSFRDTCPAWKAGYIGGWPDPQPDAPFPGSFGGWTLAHGWQCRNTSTLLGESVDMNLFDPVAFALPQEGETNMAYPLPHVDWSPPAGKPYRSYYVSGSTPEKHLVASSEHRQALVKAGVIMEPPRTLSLAELKAIPCAVGTPEADAP